MITYIIDYLFYGIKRKWINIEEINDNYRYDFLSIPECPKELKNLSKKKCKKVIKKAIKTMGNYLKKEYENDMEKIKCQMDIKINNQGIELWALILKTVVQ